MQRLINFVGAFFIFGSLVPIWRVRYWWVRIFDFPRVQMAALGLMALTGLSLQRERSRLEQALLAGVSGCLLRDLFRIWPYTLLAPRESLRVYRPSDGETLNIMVSNVLMSNRDCGRLLQVIREHEPDIVLLLETDQWWSEQMQVLEHGYPWSIQQPQDNTYGLLLFSKLPLKNSQLRFLTNDDVPSIRTDVHLSCGEIIGLYGLHPRPPGHEGAHSTERDAELMKVAQEVKDQQGAIIVCGDLNDVAWSHTTRLFRRVGRMLDPRIGRGFYNTYHVGYRLMRWPLDHIFHSEVLGIQNLVRLPDIGSDHFPILVRLAFDKRLRCQQESPQPKRDDLQEAHELVSRLSENG